MTYSTVINFDGSYLSSRTVTACSCVLSVDLQMQRLSGVGSLFSINVWAGVAGDCLVGPHDLPHQLTGNYYRYFLLHYLPKQLEDVPLAVGA
jgi:hypothetical protein